MRYAAGVLRGASYWHRGKGVISSIEEEWKAKSVTEGKINGEGNRYRRTEGDIDAAGKYRIIAKLHENVWRIAGEKRRKAGIAAASNIGGGSISRK
jgi:hypothetical protein